MGFFPSGSETQLGSLFLQGMQLVLEGAHRFCWYSPIECQKVHDRDIAYCIANDRIEDWKIIVINTYKAPAVPFGYHKSRSQTTDRTWFSRKTDPDIYTPWCDCRRIRYLNSWSIGHNCLPSVEELSDVLSNNPRHPLKYKTMFHRMFRHFVFDFFFCICSASFHNDLLTVRTYRLGLSSCISSALDWNIPLKDTARCSLFYWCRTRCNLPATVFQESLLVYLAIPHRKVDAWDTKHRRDC